MTNNGSYEYEINKKIKTKPLRNWLSWPERFKEYTMSNRIFKVMISLIILFGPLCLNHSNIVYIKSGT